MNKKIVLGTFLLGTITMLVFIFSRELGICPPFTYSDCSAGLEIVAIFFTPFFPLFLFSLILYRMNDRVYQAWWSFARVATVLMFLGILLAPSYSQDWMFPIEKSSVAFFSIIAFTIISSGIILFTRRNIR